MRFIRIIQIIQVTTWQRNGLMKTNTIHAYHDSVSKALDANVGNEGAGELQHAQVADEYLSDEAEHEVEDRHDNGGAGELPE